MVNANILIMEEEIQKELVSIITPVYNVEKYIAQTIEAVQLQTYRNWELLLVDDCSKDNSAQIIAEYKKNDLRIKYFKLEKNSGAAVARNEALSRAQGRFLAFLDSDDLWVPEKLQKEMAVMLNGESAFVFTAIKMVDENNNLIKDTISVPKRVTYERLLKETVIATSSVLLDKKVIGDFRMPLIRSGQDYATWLLILKKVSYAIGINEGLVLYRKSSNSLSSNKFKSIKQVYKIQTQNEKINRISAAFNTFCFSLYAFKKHFLNR